MMNTRTLICAAAHETRRAWAATLEALGSRTEQLEAAPAKSTDTDLIIAQLDPRAPVQVGGKSQALLVIQQPDLATYVRLLAQPGVSAVVTADYLDSRLLTYVAAKLLKGDIFGVSKVLPWGAQVLSMVVGSHDERQQALASLDQYARALGLRARHLEAIQLVADELLMNALYDAPTGASGPEYADVEPKNRSTLQLERPAILQVAGDGQRLAIAVRDGFGSLDRATVLASLDRCLRQGGQVERKTSGAGVGLYMVANHVTELVVNLIPGAATEVVCVFAASAPGQQLKHFGIYEELIPLSADRRGGRERRIVPRRGVTKGRAPGWQWVALAGAALLLATTVVLGLWPYISRAPRGSLRVSVSSPKATIYLNGAQRGVAAPALMIPDLEVSSSYVVSAREPGYEAGEEAVAVSRGRVQEVRLTLQRKRAKAYISSTPPGAEIWLSGKSTGFRTPSLIEGLEPGSRLELRLVRYGYATVNGELAPTADETLRYHTQLTVGPGFASIRLSSTPPGARLIVNDVDTGLTTPIESHLLPGGQRYRLELRQESRVPWVRTLNVEAGEQRAEQVNLAAGELVSIQANLPGRVIVGGLVRPLPFERVLPIGTHTIRLRSDQPYLDHSFVVKLKPGTKVTQSFKFGIVVAPENLRILVNKVRVAKLALPAGPHKVTLVNAKGETRTANVAVTAGEETRLE
jgi:hypothetical protein